MSDHNEKVGWIKSLLRDLNLPNLPPHIVYCEAYHPDVSTRINEGFIIMDFVNSEGQFNFDIGGLTLLLLHKDIIECCVAVISDDVYPDLVQKVQHFRNPFLERLIILQEHQFKDWLEARVKASELWEPEAVVKRD